MNLTKRQRDLIRWLASRPGRALERQTDGGYLYREPDDMVSGRAAGLVVDQLFYNGYLDADPDRYGVVVLSDKGEAS